jgi:hypothetical protein
MAEMTGFSCELPRRTGGIVGLVAALKASLSHIGFGRRGQNLRFEEWPDYLLRDIGLDRTKHDRTDPRSLPTDLLRRF